MDVTSLLGQLTSNMDKETIDGLGRGFNKHQEGFGFGNNWIIILILLLCCCNNGGNNCGQLMCCCDPCSRKHRRSRRRKCCVVECEPDPCCDPCCNPCGGFGGFGGFGGGNCCWIIILLLLCGGFGGFGCREREVCEKPAREC